jgi:hypothetical protein
MSDVTVLPGGNIPTAMTAVLAAMANRLHPGPSTTPRSQRTFPHLQPAGLSIEGGIHDTIAVAPPVSSWTPIQPKMAPSM